MLEDSAPRRVVPRWRASWLIATMPEGQPLTSVAAPDFSSALQRADAEFNALPDSVPRAAELMFIANSAGDQKLARSAAAKIFAERGSISSSSLLRSARQILGEDEKSYFSIKTNDFLKEARRLLRVDFDNPVLLVDVALAMTADGRAKGAKKFIRSAVGLAPKNRFVLRSAVRYYLHIDEPDIAHGLLLRSPNLSVDPWLMASEIAVASVLGKTSKNVKSADRHLETLDLIPANRSELGSAIATVHLGAGSEKKAKRLFARSLLSPNDNVVAQAEWAARRLNLVVPEKALEIRFTYEANSRHKYRTFDIPGAIEQAKYWMEDEPFASRPVGWLGHLYAIEDEHEIAAEYYDEVVQRDKTPDLCDLLNQNFNRIETGALDLAMVQLGQLSRHSDAKAHLPQVLANAGVLSYATGDVASGNDYYLKAATLARAKGDAREEAVVRAFHARAAAKYQDPNAKAILDAASKLASLPSAPSAAHVVSRLVDEEARRKLEASVTKRVAKQKLHWDSATNVLTLT